jgi:hypothetical protein
VGGGGTILATSDGGATWTAQNSGTTIRIFSVAFTDASHGWAVGWFGTILATSDGGANWTQRIVSSDLYTSDLYDVTFTDASHGWAVGSEGTIAMTSDGGATWVAQSGVLSEYTWGVAFADASHGWAVGHFGDIFMTSDGGATLDTTPPTTTASGADDLWHNAPVTVAFSAVDEPGGSGMSGGAAKTEYQLDAGAWTSGGSCTVPAPADHSGDGEHTVSYRSTDAAGNTEAAKSLTVRIDTTPPAGGFALAAGAAATTTASVSADSSVTDAHGPLEMRFSVDGKASWSGWEAYAASRALTLPGGLGSKTAHAQYRDAAGNLLELSDAIEVVPADTVAPTVQAAGVSDGAWQRTAVAVTLTAADPGSGVASITYALDGVETTVLAASALVDVAALPNAAHVLTFHATDVAGNASDAQTLSFTIDTSGPVTAAEATGGRRGRAVSLRYKVADNLSPAATAIRIVVKNAKGRTVTTFTPAARRTGTWSSVKWTPKARGTYRYYVYAKDLAGNAQSKLGSAKVVVR